MKNLMAFLLTVVFITATNLTAFSQVKSDTCYYQSPRVTCEQAQINAQALVKYPVALQSIELKNEMLRAKENELYHVKAGFNDERKLFEIDKNALTKSYEKELRRKKRWRFGAGVIAIMAGAFYLK